jgi:hypothetical protein
VVDNGGHWEEKSKREHVLILSMNQFLLTGQINVIINYCERLRKDKLAGH